MRLSILAAVIMLVGGAGAQAQSRVHSGQFNVTPVLDIAPQLRSSVGYMGISLVDINPDRAKTLKLGEERGVEITMVQPGSPAEAAGLKPGDVLLSYNGENILGGQQFVRLVQETPPNRKVRLQVWRDGKMDSVVVTTAAAPPRPADFPQSVLTFQIPDSGVGSLDIPSPKIIWKNMFFGMEYEAIDSQLAHYFGVKRGVLVRAVDKDSPAEKAGLRAGDVLTAIADRSVSRPGDVTSFVRTGRQPGRAIQMTLMRDHRELIITVTPPDSPQ